jgi:phosphonate transport system substrate-binding protein
VRLAGRYGAAFSLLALVTCISGCSEDRGLISQAGRGDSVEGSPVLRLTAAPDSDPAGQHERMEAFAVVLEQRLELSAEFVPAESREAAVQLFRDGSVQLGWFDAFTGREARRNVPDARVIVQGVEDKDSHSYFIANRSLGLERAAAFPEALRGRRFAYGPDGSTAGRLMPEVSIRHEAGEAPTAFFGRIEIGDSQDATLKSVNAGGSDFGALGQLAYDAADADQKANTRVIWQTPGYPDYSLSVRPELDESFGFRFTSKLTKALLALPRELCEQLMLRSGLVAASNEQFDGFDEFDGLDAFGAVDKTTRAQGLER